MTTAMEGSAGGKRASSAQGTLFSSFGQNRGSADQLDEHATSLASLGQPVEGGVGDVAELRD
jgi:hypothetical protein